MGKTTKGLKWINNGKSNKRIPLDQLSIYLNDGWVVGSLPTTLNHIWVNKDGKNTTIDKSKLDEYLANGYNKGKASSKKENNIVCVYKDSITKRIQKEELDTYIKDGWTKGIAYHYRWITNDIEEKWTDIELPKGWYEGRLLDNPNELINVYNEKEVIQIQKKDLNKYKNLGYKLGKGKLVGLYAGSTKDTIWMNNGIDTICVKKDLELAYIKKGFIRGNLNAKNRIKIHKDSITKCIKLSDLDNYLSNGYTLGTSFKPGTYTMRWVQNNDEYKLVSKDEYENYLSKGWRPGRPIAAAKNKISIHKNNKSKYIDINDLQLYLDDGWHSGRKDGAKFYITNGKEDLLIDWDTYNLNYRQDESWKFGTRDHGCSSIIEDEFKKLLDANNISYKQHFYLRVGTDKRQCYYYDFKIDNILIELNPFATHNVTWNPYDVDISIDYHYEKTKFAKEQGYRCINVWDWDSINILLSLLTQRQTVYARQCVIKEVSINDTKDFLNQYHFQGYAKDDIRLGLYYKQELISIMTFGKPRYTKRYEYELIRYCSKFNVIGGSKKLFKHFINNYDPHSIISYCNLDKFTGDMYNELGFTYVNYSIGRHWYNNQYKLHFTDNLVRQHGFDRLCGHIFGKYGKGTSNEDLLLIHDFVEIYDAGQAKYEWISSK